MSAGAIDPGLAAHQGALDAFFREATEAETAEIVAAQPLTGGAIQENWLIDLVVSGGAFNGRQELVLRTDSPTAVAVSWSRPQEFALLRAAAEAGVTVPEPLWLCADEAVIGKPFYVMRRVAGTAAGHRIVRDMSLAPDRDALAEGLGENLARIHTITPPRTDLDFLRLPDGSPAEQAIADYRRHLDDMGVAQPAVEWGLRWCERHSPPAGDLVLVHQDYRTGNLMIDETGLTGILDWEFCAWGEPMSDLGWFCAKCWRFGRTDLEAGGVAARAPFYRGYERVSGRRVDPAVVAYWEVMAHIRWAVIAIQQGRRFTHGGEDSLDLALTGRVRPLELELEILARTGPEAWVA